MDPIGIAPTLPPAALAAAVLVLLATGLVAGLARGHGHLLLRAIAIALATALLAGLAGLAPLLLADPAALAWRGPLGSGLGVQLDGLAISMVVLVSGIGLVVTRYTASMLAATDGLHRFAGRMALVLGGVLALVVADNLAQMIAAWALVGLGVHGLLGFHRGRPGARRAAAARARLDLLALAALVAAGAICATGAGSLATVDLAQLAAAGQHDGLILGLGLLLALAALLGSAQAPLHGWLVAGMETPTPVSALLHAGVVNAGGFLLLRHAELLAAAPGALLVLALIAGTSTVFAALVLATQASAKGALAWSTVAQMGFMLLQIGLGAFSLAWLHLLAHGCYKANAFLSAGDLPARWSRPAPSGERRLGALLVATAVALGLALVPLALGHQHPGGLVLGAVLCLGLTALLVQRSDADRWSTRLGGLALALAVVVLVHLLHLGAGSLSSAMIGPDLAASPLPTALAIALAVGFAGVLVLHHLAAQRALPTRLRPLQVHLANGCYLGPRAGDRHHRPTTQGVPA